MALTDSDRRRFLAATVLTLLALPALWWANTSDNSAAPSLAVAGIDPDAGAAVATASNAGATQTVEDDPAAPAFLEGPSSAAGAGQSAIAVPARPLVEDITTKATFRGNIANGTCIVSALPSGTKITVVNLNNSRSIDCTTILDPGSQSDAIVIRTSAFATIADLTDAPISVELRR